jgi:hypothetical protein
MLFYFILFFILCVCVCVFFLQVSPKDFLSKKLELFFG